MCLRVSRCKKSDIKMIFKKPRQCFTKHYFPRDSCFRASAKEQVVASGPSVDQCVQGNSPQALQEQFLEPSTAVDQCLQGNSPQALREQILEPSTAVDQCLQGNSPQALREQFLEPSTAVDQCVQGNSPQALREQFLEPSTAVYSFGDSDHDCQILKKEFCRDVSTGSLQSSQTTDRVSSGLENMRR